MTQSANSHSSELRPGDVLRDGRYEIQQLLWATCDKSVYLAQDRVLGCQVAVDAFSNDSSVVPGGLTVSARETLVLGQLGDHPNIVSVLERWGDAKTAFMSSRYLSGGSLRDRIANSKDAGKELPVESILRIATEIAQGLSYIHEHRILYRDLQPRNVLFDERDTVHLVDFDTAVSLDEHDISDLAHLPVIDYMAPELTEGESADERADLYSLGATIYEMCTGRPPFPGTRAEILAGRRTEPRPSLERDELPEELRDLVIGLLAPDREQRPTSAAEVVERLESLRAAWAARESAAALTRGDSLSLPAPDLRPIDDVLQPGTLLRDGRYEILEVLGTPQDKKVYLAYDQVVDRRVALDIFSNNFVMPSGLTVRAWEAQVLTRLGDHPNIGTVLDHWEDNNIAAMVTRYLTGGRLADRIEGSKRESSTGLPIEEVFRLSIELAYGLAYIHSCGTLYLDLQPRNILFDEWGTLHLVDFDTAIQIGDRHLSRMSQRSVINYMAPELVAGTAADERSDLYSLGATLYEMVAGSPAFAGDREEVLIARQTGRPPSLNRDGLPEGLRNLIFCLLAPSPDNRPRQADKVAGCLEQLRAGHAQIERLLKTNTDHEVLKTLATFLDTESSAMIKPTAGHERNELSFTPNIELPPDHRFLTQAIMALAETDYRRAAIDAGTASEVALSSAISRLLQDKGVPEEFIEHLILRANGIDGLFSEYLSLGNPAPVSRNKEISLGALRAQLAGVRNKSAHAGTIPSAEEATRAVELAHSIVTTAHPFEE
jgi:serine/threonine protein kinase